MLKFYCLSLDSVVLYIHGLILSYPSPCLRKMCKLNTFHILPSCSLFPPNYYPHTFHSMSEVLQLERHGSVEEQPEAKSRSIQTFPTCCHEDMNVKRNKGNAVSH